MAVDHEGKELWKRKWPEFASDHGFGASPILADGVLILHTDSVKKEKSLIIGLDPETGKSLREVERVTESAEPPPTPGLRWEGSRGNEKGNSSSQPASS